MRTVLEARVTRPGPCGDKGQTCTSVTAAKTMKNALTDLLTAIRIAPV